MKKGGHLFLNSEPRVARATEKQIGRAVEILNAIAHDSSSRGDMILARYAGAGTLTLRRAPGRYTERAASNGEVTDSFQDIDRP